MKLINGNVKFGRNFPELPENARYATVVTPQRQR
jgi:hypothetical protein